MIRLLDHFKKQDSKLPAIIQAQDKLVLSYDELLSKVESVSNYLSTYKNRHLVFLYTSNSIDSIVVYLACLNSDFPICLLEPNKTNLSKLVDIYKPPILFLSSGLFNLEGYIKGKDLTNNTFVVYESTNSSVWEIVPHKDLSLLLQTSGSTGDPKLVRLSQKNIESNASSIAQYLNLSPKEKSIQGLPMQYSYGLSLINSHFISGGAVVLTPHSFMQPDFWQDFDSYSCTSFAGVPFMYETLHRLGFNPSSHLSLSTMTQAGGNLKSTLVESFHAKAVQSKINFYVMYGQTEATARITYVPTEMLGKKIGSIGIPIPNGQIELEKIENSDVGEEIIYKGPNVMMGYAESISHLTKGDELNGVLHTGDLARIDSDGYYYVTGRLKRFVKLFGKRINLQKVESSLEASFPPVNMAVIGSDENLVIYAELKGNKNIKMSEIKNYLAKRLSIPPVAITVKEIDTIPMTNSGKKNYKELAL